MNNKFHRFIESPPTRLLAAGITALTVLAAPLHAQYVSTAISNTLSEPYGVTTDTNNNLYVTDSVKNRIVQYVNSGSTLSTFATGFNAPSGIVYSPGRNALVVVDQGNQVLRLVTLSGTVSTLAGELGQSGSTDGAALGQAQFYYPSGIAVANDGTSLYIADQGNDAIRLLSNNAVSTIATGYVYNSVPYSFRSPAAVAVDSSSNVWVTDTGHDVLCVISNGTTTAQVIAGVPSIVGTNDSLTAANARFKSPSGLYWDPLTTNLLISDTQNDTIRALYITNGGYAVKTLTGIPGTPGYIDGGLTVAELNKPFGICADLFASGYYFVDQANNAVRVLQPAEPPPPPIPVPDPVIGYVTFPVNNGTPEAQFNPITQQISIFDNPVVLAIQQLDPTVSTYLSHGVTGTIIPPPGTNTETVNAFTAVDDGTLPDQAYQYQLTTPIEPNLTLETISVAKGRPTSATVSAEIEYVTANPNIIGQNAEAVTLDDATTNAQMWYTLDGSVPVPGASNTFPPSTVAGISSGQVISFVPTSNTTLTVQAFTSNSMVDFAPSGVVSALFTTNNFVTDQITLGFASGECSSKFMTAPGQTFIAPVTMTLIPTAQVMYSLQFNLAVTTNGPSGNTASVPTTGANALTFSSMLMQQFNPGPVYFPIPPAMVGGLVITAVTNTNTMTTNYFTNGAYTNLVFTNILTNTEVSDLLGVGWVERPPATNLYNTKQQTLITYSIAHDTVFQNTGNQVVVGGFSFYVPTTATNGAQYEIQVGSPSATSDGIATPVVINVVSNGSLTNGAVNSTKYVTVGTNQYLVGDVAPFYWFNAGDFGDGLLENNDVTETFQTAVYGLNGPNAATTNSDYFDAMDSSNGNTNNQYNPYSDSVINSILYGDHVIAVDDVWVTYRRSLDPGLLWVYRSDTAAGKHAVTGTNKIAIPFGGAAPFSSGSIGAQPQLTSSGPRYISVAADQVISGSNPTVTVPVRVLAADTLPVTVMMLRVEIDPLDGSPPIVAPINFTPNANLGQAFTTESQFTNDFAGVWLNSSDAGVSGTGILGTVSVPLPSTVTPNSAYLVHFDHFSASPNGIGLFHTALQDGLITVSDRSGSSWHDGIPDSWRLLWFGTVSNGMSAADLDPDGDGASNWQEYVAGTDPLNGASVFQFLPGSSSSSPSGFTLQWSSVVNKSYTIQGSYNPAPGNWTTLATNILGTGQIMQWTDPNAGGKAEFYRALVQ